MSANEKRPVIEVTGLKKQYKLGQIGGGTLTHDLQSWWARVRGKEDPNTVIGTDQRLFGQTFMALNGVDLTVHKGDTDGTVGYNGAGKFLAFFDECSTRKAEVMIRILQSQVDEYNKLNPEYPILFTAAWATTSEEELYHVRDLVRCAQKKMSLIAEEGGAVLAGTERGEA